MYFMTVQEARIYLQETKSLSNAVDKVKYLYALRMVAGSAFAPR